MNNIHDFKIVYLIKEIKETTEILHVKVFLSHVLDLKLKSDDK